MMESIDKDLLHNSIDYLREKIKDDKLLENEKKFNVYTILIAMSRSVDTWLSICPFSYRFRKGDLEESLKELIHGKCDNDNINMDLLLLRCIHFLRECIISPHRKDESYNKNIYINSELGNIWIWFLSLNEEDIDGRWKTYFLYIKNDLPIFILNYHIGEKSFQSFLNFEDNINKAEQERQKCETNIQKEIDRADAKIVEVQRLESALKEYKEGFNFVGLSQGFSSLLSKKENNKKWIFGSLIVIGLAIISLPLVNLFFINVDWKTVSWQQMIASIGLEFVLIYFFRITLQHYRSVQTQIMQLELRLSLCQFIQNYAEYAKEIKENDNNALEKFENLIFSSILSNDNNIPGTFDGMEQISQLIKDVKSKP